MEPFGYYTSPVIKKVKPLRSSVVNDFQSKINRGMYQRDNIPKFG